MKRTSSSGIPKATSSGSTTSSSRQSLGPLRVRDENRNSGIGIGTRARSSFGQGRSSFGQSRVSIGRPGVKRPLGNSTTGTTPGKSRRSSGYGSKGGKPKEDPRNVRSKPFQNSAIRNLLEFLQTNGFTHPINAKILGSPQTKDFIKVFEFLMTFLEPNYKIIGKMEEEVPRILKAYCYPFPISKSSMFAVGSPTTWPAILGALDWLREVIEKNLNEEIDDIIFGRSDDDFDAAIPKQKVLWNYVGTTYDQFMQGADSFEELETELAKQIRTSGASGHLERLADENRRLKETTELLEASRDPLTEVRETIANLQVDLEKLRSYSAELDNHAKKMLGKKSETDQEVEMHVARRDAMQREEEEKRHIYETQEYSRADVERINRNKLQLKGNIELLEGENADFDQQIWEKEIQITKEQEKCNQSCSEYQRIAHMNKLVPISAENAFGLDLELKTTTHWHNADIFADVKPALLEVRKQWKENNQEMNEKITSMQEAHEQVEEMVIEKKDTVIKDEAKVTRVDKDIQMRKEDTAREVAQLEEQLERSRDSCEKSMRDRKQHEGRLEETQRKLKETRLVCLEEERERHRENTASKQVIVNAVERIVEHKSRMQEKAAELKTLCRNLAFTERNNFVNDGGILPWEQPGYSGQVPTGLPRWIDGHGLVKPCNGKGGWEPVAVTKSKTERTKSGTLAAGTTSEHRDATSDTSESSQGTIRSEGDTSVQHLNGERQNRVNSDKSTDSDDPVEGKR